ncbi:MAG: ArnT family glycosyltransferase [Longimicrobiales bacterium]
MTREGGMSEEDRRARSRSRESRSEGPPSEARPWNAPGTAWALLGVVVLVQVGLMVGAFLPVPHTGGDNAGYLGLAYSLLERGAYLDLYLPGEPIHTKYPPGFPLLLAGARILGAETWVAFKAVVAVSATLAVAFTFLWAREGRSPVFAALVAGLLAVSSALVYYSHWILSDVPFLALTFLALWGLERWERPGARTGDAWLALGAGAAILAYFTRSAGLPLILALAGVLLLRRRWKSLAAFGVAFAVPAFAWWLRNRGAPDTYLAELWLVDPYQPDLGTVGIGGLVGRVLSNAWGYTARHVPTGITGLEGGTALVLGVGLVGLALYGWAGQVRRQGSQVRALEIFFPLYAGLILIWPEVWSGDRFALPLLPPLFLYGGLAVRDLASRIHPRGAAPAGVAGVLILGGTALWSWAGQARTASSCMSLTRSQGAWACAPAAMADFARAAAWSGLHLPEGSAVFSRKPRFFYLLGGVKSQVFPFSGDPDAFFREAERWDIGYVLLDRLDDLAAYYVGAAVRSHPGSFCPVHAFGTRTSPGSQLLGLVETPGGGVAADGDSRDGEAGAGAARGGGPGSGDEIRLSPCPPEMIPGDPEVIPDYSSSVVPLFGRSAS